MHFREVTSDRFDTLDEARENARDFVRAGGRITEGGARPDGSFGWTGRLPRVDDDDANVKGNFGCDRCARTGNFITMSVNGKPTGPGGICFRCNGKGFHHQKDRRRNAARDRHAFMREARRMARGE